MTDSKATGTNTRLDWSKLLGFDQIKHINHGELKLTDLRFSKIGSKSCTGPKPNIDQR
jgi:hypothetical protein